ncbi:MAG TPA: response regulator [Candidatus Dormibacteraeota bacterium]|nr:response regulator [Candidatus Dormibacteraeota bacterium]
MMVSVTMHPKLFLLVDDDPVAIAVTERGFKSCPVPVEIKAITDGIEASRYINGTAQYADRSIYPLPDAILLDIQMPRFSGLDFLRWLREQAPQHARTIPVVIISSSMMSQHLATAECLGIVDYFLKPISWPKFWPQLTGLLQPQVHHFS